MDATDPMSSGGGGDERVAFGQFLQLFSAVMLPMFLAAVDQTLLATATPAIARDLGGLRDSAWIAVGYLLASTIVVPLYGRLGDRHGRRDALAAALALFALGSAVCAAAGGMWWLTAARVLQGLGGGGLMVMSQALIGELVPPRQRARFQAWFGVVFVLASVSGPVLGGLVVARWSWRWLFLVNLPLAAVAAWRVLRLPASPRHAAPDAGFDVRGAALFAVSAAATLLWVSLGGRGSFAWVSVPSLALAGFALGTGVLLLRVERGLAHPFLPLELLRQRPIAIACLTTALFASCMFALVFFLPVYLQVVRHGSAAHAGLLLLPLTAGIVVGANVTGRVVARSGRPDLPPRFGLPVSAVAMAGLALGGPVGLLGLLAGLGFGTVMPSSQVLIQTVAGRARLGAASATLSLARSSGAVLGTAVFGALVFGMAAPADLHAALGGADPAATLRIEHVFHFGFGCAAALGLLAAGVATRMPRVEI